MTPERRTSTLNNATSVVSLDTISSFHLIGYQRFCDSYGENASDQGDMLEDSHQGLVDNIHSSVLSAGRSRRQTNRDLPGNF